MNFNPLVASVTVAVGALAALAALIWQVTHNHEADAQLAGIVGLLFGAFLRVGAHTPPTTSTARRRPRQSRAT